MTKYFSALEKSVLNIFNIAVDGNANEIHIVIDSTGCLVKLKLVSGFQVIGSYSIFDGHLICETIMSMCNANEENFYSMFEQELIIQEMYLPYGIKEIRVITLPQSDGYIMKCFLVKLKRNLISKESNLNAFNLNLLS